MHHFNIRSVTGADKQKVMQICSAIGLFENDELPAMEGMLDAYLEGNLGEGHHWLVVEEQHNVIGSAYFAPEPFAIGTWNTYFIGVDPASQRHGAGSALIRHIEHYLQIQGERILLVETSSLPALEKARCFYSKTGYLQAATIPEYYKAGDDKIVLWKKLN